MRGVAGVARAVRLGVTQVHSCKLSSSSTVLRWMILGPTFGRSSAVAGLERPLTRHVNAKWRAGGIMTELDTFSTLR